MVTKLMARSPAQSWPWSHGMQEAILGSDRPTMDELEVDPSKSLYHPNQS